MRAATHLPIDLYVESPDSLGGVVRGNELGDLVHAGRPLYAKFGLRNSRMIYPSGLHLVDEARLIAREKVRRAAVALEWLRRHLLRGRRGLRLQHAAAAEEARARQGSVPNRS